MSKAYTIIMKAEEKTAEVNLYGEVVESVPTNWWTGEPIDGLFICLEQFVKDLDGLKDMKEITFRINSVGGDAEAGIAIYHRIRELDAATTTIVDGLAASAASIIAQAGDKRVVNVGTQTMIHGASTFQYGFFNEQELRKTARALGTINKSIAGIYADRSGREVEEILSMMKAEKWMTYDEAVEEGFADEVGGKDAPKAEATEGIKNMITVNGITHNLRNIPMPQMPQMKMMIAQKKTAEETDHIDSKPTNEEGVKKMDLKELKENHAELCAEFKDEILKENQVAVDEMTKNAVENALREDRERMKAIDTIANQVGDPDLIQKAKYEEPMTAEQLALKAMQMQAEAGKSFAQARSEEVSASGTENVQPAPVNGTEEDTTARDIAEAAALIAGVKNEKEDK